jgi:hypothetical protein
MNKQILLIAIILLSFSIFHELFYKYIFISEHFIAENDTQQKSNIQLAIFNENKKQCIEKLNKLETFVRLSSTFSTDIIPPTDVIEDSKIETFVEKEDLFDKMSKLNIEYNKLINETKNSKFKILKNVCELKMYVEMLHPDFSSILVLQDGSLDDKHTPRSENIEFLNEKNLQLETNITQYSDNYNKIKNVMSELSGLTVDVQNLWSNKNTLDNSVIIFNKITKN